MIHPDTQLTWIDDHVGLGVVATKRILAGTAVWVKDPLDLRISKRRAQALGPLFEGTLRRYCFSERASELILCWDHARYVNHACDANCLGGGFEFEVAIRDIEAGEQLTDDYSTFGYEDSFNCRCGARECRGVVRRSDAQWLAPQWDATLLAAMQRFNQVDQPLQPLIRNRQALEKVLADPAALRRHRVAA